MKKALLIIFLTPLFCFGQKTSSDSTRDKTDKLITFGTGVALTLTGTVGTTTTPILSIQKHDTIDTIKVLMLVCDTTYKVPEWSRNPVYFIYGYNVLKTEYVPEHYLADAYYIGSYQTNHFYYLDADKNPLPKNIIVWMAK